MATATVSDRAERMVRGHGTGPVELSHAIHTGRGFGITGAARDLGVAAVPAGDQRVAS
jgi:hypothetical protein